MNIPVFLQRLAPAALVLAVFLCALTACSPSSLLGGGNWQRSGLEHQQIQVLLTDPSQQQHLFAGDAQDGIFVSNDAGVHWQASNHGLTLPTHVSVLAFDPTGKKLYAATSHGLYVSHDSASTWSQLPGTSTDTYTALAFNLHAPHLLYAGTTSGLMRSSSDDGATWTTISHGLPSGSPVVGLLYDATQKQLWVAFAEALYRSDNGGASWLPMNSGLPARVGINVLAQGTVGTGQAGPLLLGTDHGFFLSLDDGQHWMQSQSSLAALRITTIFPDTTQLETIYIATSIGVLKSPDNGQTWTSVAAGLPNAQLYRGLTQGDTDYAQLLVGGSGIYRYPGTAGSLDLGHLLPLVLLVLFFVLLYRYLVVRRRRVRRNVPQNEENDQKQT